MRRFHPLTGLVLALTLLVAGGCGKKETPYDTNLLENPSFEEVGSDGLPKGWELVVFRGLPEQPEVRYSADDNVKQDGERSWSFTASYDTRRFYMLTQEIEVPPISHIQLKGWIQTDQCKLHPDQFAQSNYLLTFYDEDHARFQELRVADKRTRVNQGTRLWFEEDNVFRVPDGTRYVAVSCILGMDGRIWFDNVSLSIPKPIDWEISKTPNFVYHWLPGHPPPDGAIANQQAIFDKFAQKLGLPDSDVVINYYFYPDTTTIRDILSLKGHQYVSWDDQEFHSINANDDHEVIHFITDPYGQPPRAIAEGTVFWLYGEWDGRPIRELAAYLLANDMLASFKDITNYNSFMILDARVALPTAAALVDYLVTRYGTEKLIEFYRNLSGANSYSLFCPAIEKTYGIPCNQVEQEFQAAVSQVDYSVIEEMGLPENK